MGNLINFVKGQILNHSCRPIHLPLNLIRQVVSFLVKGFFLEKRPVNNNTVT